MSTVSIVVTQYFADAAGFALTSDGRLSHGNNTLLNVTVQNGKITPQAHYDVLGLVAEQMPDRAAISIRHARSIDLDRLGTLALACKVAPTVRGVLQRLAQYHTVLSNSVHYSLEVAGNTTLLQLDTRNGFGPGLVFAPEAGLSALFEAVGQFAAAKIVPERVTFQHTGSRDAYLFEEFFGCAVRFESEVDGIVFSDASLDTQNKLGDAALSSFLTRHLDVELGHTASDASLVRSTKEEIARVLSEGPPKVADVAGQLGYSVRSFRRRLADHGATYQALAENTRRELALGMLQDESCSLSEIAFLTGFSEQSAFNRAFKRWTQQTPANYRRSLAR